MACCRRLPSMYIWIDLGCARSARLASSSMERKRCWFLVLLQFINVFTFIHPSWSYVVNRIFLFPCTRYHVWTVWDAYLTHEIAIPYAIIQVLSTTSMRMMLYIDVNFSYIACSYKCTLRLHIIRNKCRIMLYIYTCICNK